MDISFIGSGNIATHFAKAFRQRGHNIKQICSPHIEHAQQLATATGSEAISSISQLSATDLLVLAVPDNQLYSLPSSLPLVYSTLIHTSGSVPMDVLGHHAANHGVVWTPQSVVKEAAINYNTLPFCIEASNDATRAMLTELCGSISDHLHYLTSEQRQWAHLACVFANNFGNALNATAQQLLESHGMAAELIVPIIQTTAQRATTNNLWCYQTGPAARGDDKTMQKQRYLLSEHPEALQLYDTFSTLIQAKCKKIKQPCL